MRLPALIVDVALPNAGFSREENCVHPHQFPGQQNFSLFIRNKPIALLGIALSAI
jgi:hypothetical protein